ncbi:MAG: class I SAM-dependent methyltransferase [Leptolyngbyaceae cyanobacterium CSU_1_4]|nr:class I SAM-dependent methyltransferase [Leptolyngbyaceae cyanobacterium CSU_1_4]
MKAINPSPKMNLQCPLCAHSSRRLFCKYAYWIRSCNTCNHHFAEILPSPNHVDRVYDDQYFTGSGSGYPDYLAEARILRSHGRRYARLLSRYVQPGTMLDVGAAAGFILEGFLDSGWNGRGIEPNLRMAKYAQTHLGVEVDTGSLEQFQSHDRYDLITMIQVVSHFYNLQQAFQVASSHTRLGGFWLIETWNRNSLTARLLNKYWHEYSPPSVMHWFSVKGLQQLAAQHGFREIARGRPAKWINGAHAKSLLRYKLNDMPMGKWFAQPLNLIPDSFAIPYPAEDLFWTLYQKDS